MTLKQREKARIAIYDEKYTDCLELATAEFSGRLGEDFKDVLAKCHLTARWTQTEPEGKGQPVG